MLKQSCLCWPVLQLPETGVHALGPAMLREHERCRGHCAREPSPYGLPEQCQGSVCLVESCKSQGVHVSATKVYGKEGVVRGCDQG